MGFLYNQILGIPERALLNKKITKTFLIKNFELTAGEKKLLNTIVDIDWLASIKHTTVNVPALKNDVYSYEEIQVIVCTVPDNTLKDVSAKCIELIQKYIPYQTVLIVEDNTHFVINVCDKRINLNDTSKRIITKYLTTPALSKLYKNEVTTDFFKAINFNALDKYNLELMYKSYTNAVVQFQTAMVTGAFDKRNARRTEEDLIHLENIDKLEKEIITLSNQVKKETQLNHQVSLNIEIQRKRHEILAIKDLLNTL